MGWQPRAQFPAVFERRLGLTEASFYWDSQFNGTADTLQWVEANAPQAENLPFLFHPRRVERAWLYTKKLFPLLGASLEGKPGDTPSFVVKEFDLQDRKPDEIQHIPVKSEVEVEEFVERLLNGPRMLSDHLLARLFILPDSANDRVHLLLHVAHLITDGVANYTILRTLLDALSTGEGTTTKVDLGTRLALSVASEEITPWSTLTPAKRRWRALTARVLQNLDQSILKGGHTLPRKFSDATAFTPAKSGVIYLAFLPEESARVIQNCHTQRFTFGNALPILGQVALTRVLCRRWLRGEISAEEWEFRKREPMYSSGPLNLRPFLDKQWFDGGGATNVMVSIGFFFLRLPFMPLGAAANIQPGSQLPDFQDLLSCSRFNLRTNEVKRQITSQWRSPLYLEKQHIQRSFRFHYNKEIANRWKSGQSFNHAPIPVPKQAGDGFILGHGGASIGNIEAMMPYDYPLIMTRTTTTPVIRLLRNRTLLHCRPGELYLGAATVRGQLALSIFWDQNVFDKTLVQEWLDETRDAVSFYLGDKNPSTAITKL